LLFWKTVKIVATRCQIFWLKCTKFDFGWGSPQTPLGELTAFPTPLAGFKGLTSKGREERGGGEKQRVWYGILEFNVPLDTVGYRSFRRRQP